MKSFCQFLLVIICLSSAVKSQSCENIFGYFSDYGGTFGQVKVPHVPLQQVTYVELHLSLAARLPSVKLRFIFKILD